MSLTCQVCDVDPTKLFAVPTDTFIRFRIIKQLIVISTSSPKSLIVLFIRVLSSLCIVKVRAVTSLCIVQLRDRTLGQVYS